MSPDSLETVKLLPNIMFLIIC